VANNCPTRQTNKQEKETYNSKFKIATGRTSEGPQGQEHDNQEKRPTGAGQPTRDKIEQPTGAEAIKNESNIIHNVIKFKNYIKNH